MDYRRCVIISCVPLRVTLLALLLALAATVFLLIAPFYTGTRATAVGVTGQPAPPPVVETRSATLIEVNGPGVLIPLSVPLALTALTALWLAAGRSTFRRPVAVVAALLLVVFCVLTFFSIGLYYVPAAIAMVVAAALLTRST